MIRALHEADADALVALRREALLDTPLAFASSPDDDRLATVESARAQLSNAGGALIFGAFRPDLVGMAGVYRDRHVKSAHKMFLWGMYVTPAHRRHGTAAALLQEVLRHARRTAGVEWVQLGVSDACPAARRLYEQAGFRTWGTEPDALRHGGRAGSIAHMALRVAPGPASREERES